MKSLTPMIILILAITALCIWDGIYTHNTFKTMIAETSEISSTFENTNDTNYADLHKKIEDLNNYWTKRVNVLCISISKKDLQPVSDYIQYLASAINNENDDDCITYSRLLSYNIQGLSEAYGMSLTNLL